MLSWNGLRNSCKGMYKVMSVKEFVIKKGDAHIDCISFGKGDKPLVLIHGLNLRGIKGSGLTLSLAYKKFWSEYKIYVFDRIDPLPENVTIKDLADDIVYCMDELGISTAAFIGISQGGMIVQRLAIDHPSYVNALVLGVTLSRSNPTVDKVVNSWIELGKKGDYESILKDCLVKMYSPAYIKKYKFALPLVAKTKKLMPPERFVALAKSCVGVSTYDELDRIKCRSFVIGGLEDKVVTAKASIEMARKLDCPCHMYEGLGHAAYEEAKDFNDRIFDFLQSE